ncbi:poly(rC)-binding protein 3 isoform X2 [Daktulosphaira vitifoliae]|uniref:poly(rC)-binding protein 3 isoform X2 n=1 Tax=Daktulosphaira vitifoliae TaxID=58002 RepID=UPI0021A97F6D|nr:poly(rC)-binding protein 3 isoform X2 [Daktulosphaira vitifoliae]
MDAKSKDDSNINLTLRLIMQGKEVGSIIGKKGEIVKRFREESGAKINISDGSCPERIVTISGSTEAIYKAFSLICTKVEEFIEMQNGKTSSSIIGKCGMTLRLIVPASQCGSLIGKGGNKIKEIREATGAQIQVASDVLPQSTERAVTLTGTRDSITQCIFHICAVMIESPPKGVTIPYRAKPQIGAPVILAGGQAFTLASAGSAAGCDVGTMMVGGGPFNTPMLMVPPTPGAAASLGLIDPLDYPLLKNAFGPSQLGKLTSNPLAGLAALGLGTLGGPANSFNPAALAALAGSQLRSNGTGNNLNSRSGGNHQTHEMTVPNDLIGCIIGKGGTKIAEIRQISGAMIRISNCEDREGSTSSDRTITISGNPDSVALAQYLINMRISMETAGLAIPGYHYVSPNHIVKSPIH